MSFVCGQIRNVFLTSSLYNFPANSVKQRWESNGAMFLDTAMLGSIKIKIAVDNQRITNEEMIKTETFFTNNQKYWYWQREG